MSVRRFLVLHGPNLSERGAPPSACTPSIREINRYLEQLATDLGVKIDVFQSDHDGALVDKLFENMDTVRGCIINAGGLIPGVALHDALKLVPFPVIEVHLSNGNVQPDGSLITSTATGQITGLGWRGYLYALLALVDLTRDSTGGSS